MKQTIGDFLATLRRANGYTQQDIADKLSISNKTLSNWECNKVLPDILLLPAIAELYGVTVDEILAGERKERNEIVLSSNSERKILKSKLARFSMQSWILLGIIISGVILTAICATIEITKVYWSGFPWWRFLLVVGAVPVVLCLATLFAFWKGAEMSVDDTSEDYGRYCLILRKKLANSLYVTAATSIFAAIIVTAALLIKGSYLPLSGILTCVAFGVFALTLFVTGWLLYKSALTKFGGEGARQAIGKDRRYFWSVGFWGSFPMVLSVILAIVLGCVSFTEKQTIYESTDIREFVQYMETFADYDSEKHFPLSELAQTAKVGDEFDLGDGYVAVYHPFSFTISNEHIMLLEENGDQIMMHTLLIDVPRFFLIEDDETFSFYNVRYWYLDMYGDNDGESYVKYNHYIVERVGEGMAYVHEIVRDYSSLGYMIAFPIIAADLLICLSLCVWKRNKFAVKL